MSNADVDWLKYTLGRYLLYLNAAQRVLSIYVHFQTVLFNLATDRY